MEKVYKAEIKFARINRFFFLPMDGKIELDRILSRKFYFVYLFIAQFIGE